MLARSVRAPRFPQRMAGKQELEGSSKRVPVQSGFMGLVGLPSDRSQPYFANTRTTAMHLLAVVAPAFLLTAVWGLCGSISIRFSR